MFAWSCGRRRWSFCGGLVATMCLLMGPGVADVRRAAAQTPAPVVYVIAVEGTIDLGLARGPCSSDHRWSPAANSPNSRSRTFASVGFVRW